MGEVGDRDGVHISDLGGEGQGVHWLRFEMQDGEEDGVGGARG